MLLSISADADVSWPDGVGLTVLPEVDSTNEEAMRIAPGLTGPHWILGLRQTGGRGRGGRPWIDPAGNFAATLVMPVTEAAATVALRSFVASLALFDSLVTLTGRPEIFALKWPNDVLLNGGKLAGILLENLPSGHLAIGIGINLRAAPSAADVEKTTIRPVCLSGQTGVQVLPEELLRIIAPAYAMREAQFTSCGFGPIREAWLARAARLGTEIRARIGSRDTAGTFETVDDQGRLILSTTHGRQAIPAAEVFF